MRVRRTNLHTINPLAKEVGYYYSLDRPEILEAIVAAGLEPGHVLELGCSSGAFGAKLKQRFPLVRYVGFEIHPPSAAKAKAVLDEVHVIDVEETPIESVGLAKSSFDLLVLLDVLEHLYNPWDVLAELVQYLQPGGMMFLSIPNVQNITVLDNLIRGRWQYEAAGLLDATHIRFFALADMIELVHGSGLTIVEANATFQPPLDLARITDENNVVHFGNATVANLTRDEVIRLHAYQYIVQARKD